MVRRLFCALLALWMMTSAGAEGVDRAKVKMRDSALNGRTAAFREMNFPRVNAESPLEKAMESGSPYESLIRLHVIAEDDTEAAQARKLKVRDAALKCAQAMLSGCADAETAWSVLNARKGDLESAARAAAESDGMVGSVRAETGVFPFPDRDYGGVIVPAGEYRALRIVLGSGAGKNWWCVLYPTLCVPPEAAKRSLIAEWFRSIFGLEELR